MTNARIAACIVLLIASAAQVSPALALGISLGMFIRVWLKLKKRLDQYDNQSP